MLDHSRVLRMDQKNQPQQLKNEECCVKANAGELGDHWINNLDTGRAEEQRWVVRFGSTEREGRKIQWCSPLQWVERQKQIKVWASWACRCPVFCGRFCQTRHFGAIVMLAINTPQTACLSMGLKGIMNDFWLEGSQRFSGVLQRLVKIVILLSCMSMKSLEELLCFSPALSIYISLIQSSPELCWSGNQMTGNT